METGSTKKRERLEEQNFRGVRMSNCGKWVAETPCPNKGTTIWLGSYSTQLAAARAYDTAVYNLHGPTAWLNFPDLVLGESRLTDLSTTLIQKKAFEAGQRVDALEPGLIRGEDSEPEEPGCKGCGSCCGPFQPENPKVQAMEKGSTNKRERLEKQRFKGVRMRKWGKWIATTRIGLGSYSTPIGAARAYDTAVYNLYGPAAGLNFPDLVLGESRLTDLSIKSIKDKALEVGKRVDAIESGLIIGSGRDVVDEKPDDSSGDDYD